VVNDGGMPRAIWTGAISFGLVNIPAKLYPAVSRKSVSFNQIDTRTGSRVRLKKVSAADGSDVPPEDIARGYELDDGRYVLIDDDELASLDPAASRTIDIEQFCDLADIDPIFYDAAYTIAPDKNAMKPYALLLHAMDEAGKVAIARFVMRTKQYLAALRPADGRLVLSTMVYADEINTPADLDELQGVDDIDVSDKELTMARQLIETLDGPFEPDKFEDEHREKVLAIIEAKANGATDIIGVPAAEPTDNKVVDLMAALEQSVREAKKARKAS
jgi:DNA end-binding protein Ku